MAWSDDLGLGPGGSPDRMALEEWYRVIPGEERNTGRYCMVHAEDLITGEAAVLRVGDMPLMRDERLAAALRQIPGVVRVIPRQPVAQLLVMEDLGHETLQDQWASLLADQPHILRDRRTRLGEYRTRIAQVVEILETLHALHGAGIGFGDLHAGNVMFRDGHPVLIDLESVNWLGKPLSRDTMGGGEWLGGWTTWTVLPNALPEPVWRTLGDRQSVRADVAHAALLLDLGTLGRMQKYAVEPWEEPPLYLAKTRFEQRLDEVIRRGVGVAPEPYGSAAELRDALLDLLDQDLTTPPVGLAPGEDTLVLPVHTD